MELKRIKITGLFQQFNYDFEINGEENITILTGPNGYGKTIILNILYNLFSFRFFFFDTLSFSEIILFFKNNTSLIIKKENDNIRELQRIDFKLNKSNKEVEKFVLDDKLRTLLMYEIKNKTHLKIYTQNTFIDSETDNIISLNNLLSLYGSALNRFLINFFKIQVSTQKEIYNTINSSNVFLIREQRLLRPSDRDEKFDTNYIANTITDYAADLKYLIEGAIKEYSKISQELDSSFPGRLINFQSENKNNNFKKRFEILKGKLDKLREFGISSGIQSIPKHFNDENARVLNVYLEDSEKKIKAFDGLIQKIELFTTILNKRRFAFKTIKIDSSLGFSFLTDNNIPLDLNNLSSGEQHEVVLLFNLIFKTQPGTLVLIDEPEISLHVAWQIEFLNDIDEIITMKDIGVIIATHSPQIINDRWHLTINLETQDSK